MMNVCIDKMKMDLDKNDVEFFYKEFKIEK